MHTYLRKIISHITFKMLQQCHLLLDGARELVELVTMAIHHCLFGSARVLQVLKVTVEWRDSKECAA